MERGHWKLKNTKRKWKSALDLPLNFSLPAHKVDKFVSQCVVVQKRKLLILSHLLTYFMSAKSITSMFCQEMVGILDMSITVA